MNLTKEIIEFIEMAFDTGYDAGFYRGFDKANKVNSRQIKKP